MTTPVHAGLTPPLPLDLLPGYGLGLVPEHAWQGAELEELLGKVLLWEPPRPGHLYVLSADVSDGLGLDRSCVDITRVGTVEEIDEQVAQFVSATIDPIDLAYVVDAMGRFYTGSDGLPALAAVEVNGHGMATQSELSRHLGYDNCYIWQFEDAADPARRMSTKVGWETNRRSRPLILTRYVKRVRTVDKNTGLPDYRINSPFTKQELRNFQTMGGLEEAEADPTLEDAHDDCIMAGAIGLHIAQTLQMDSNESVADMRKRKAEERARRDEAAQKLGSRRDFRNTEATSEDMAEYLHEVMGSWEGEVS